ncbi:hypothetical protein D9Q98_004098 [Chlorella vulgaris]|uniref:Uncharacterized protein n=1 Tax=Chlorella vulgaris TaxID=3077 RepID=A0A9D4YXS6_CHLVU|nr:hypothetical protein D9Q98_004098 [Chlorella vulgaris]
MEWLEAVVADEMPLVGDLDYEGSLRAVASLIDVYIGRPSPARMEDTDLFDEAVQLAVWMMHHRERLTPAHQKALESAAMVWRWFESESERRDAETTIRRHMPHDMVEWWEAALGPTPPMPIPDDANEFHNRLEDHMLPSLWTALGTTGQYAQGTAADTDEALLMTWLLCAGVYDELTEEDMDLARAILPLFDVDNLGTIDTVNGILDAAEALKVEE